MRVRTQLSKELLRKTKQGDLDTFQWPNKEDVMMDGHRNEG